MSRPVIGLREGVTDRPRTLVARDSAEALAALSKLAPSDFVLPAKAWSNRITGRTMGDHMEETAQKWNITRKAQDDWAYQSHKRAAAGWDGGFFDDLVLALP